MMVRFRGFLSNGRVNMVVQNEVKKEAGASLSSKKGKAKSAVKRAVKVPKQFEPLFQKAQEYVRDYFSRQKFDPSKGTIEISDERYILVRAASMSVDFFETVKRLYSDIDEKEAFDVAYQLLFDIAHAIGYEDAKNFQLKMDLKDPIEKLSAGPVHFAYAGWAFVDIFPESNPTPDENYYLIYDHPYSFESDAWIKKGKKSTSPVCVMNAGYSSGWCAASFDIPLVAYEIMCKAQGDSTCRFIMAQPSKIEGFVNDYLNQNLNLAKKISTYKIPGFFERKTIEEKLRRSEELYRKQFEEAQDAIFLAEADSGILVDCNDAAVKLIGRSKAEMIGQHQRILHPPKDIVNGFNKAFLSHRAEKEGISIDTQVVTKSGELKEVSIKGSIIKLDNKKLLSGVFRDITERKRALQELEHRFGFEKIIYDVSREFAAVREEGINKALNGVLNIIGSFVRVDRCYVYTFKDDIICKLNEWHVHNILSSVEVKQEVNIKDWEWFQGVLEEGKAKHIYDVEKLPKSASAEKEFLRNDNIKSLLIVPITQNNQTIGFIGFDSVFLNKNWRQADIDLLQITAEIISQAFSRKQALLKEKEDAKILKKALMDVVVTLGLTSEKRDPYTAGHQERVSMLAELIAKEVGLDEKCVEGVKLGALIHDLGKYNIPSEILNRPGRLTALEFDLIKEHPKDGYDILKDVVFPWPIAKMVLQHHERMDGSGYPDGLKGDKIILEARILAVADVVEAICSSRPYRPALKFDVAVQEITKNNGESYDGKIVDACMRLIKSGRIPFACDA